MAKDQDHPLPARVSHWVNLICFLILGITGFVIHGPKNGSDLNLVRNLHFVFAYLLIFNGLFRIYYSLFGKDRDYREFLFNKQDAKNFVGIVKYYLFIGKHPETGKYNPLQKGAYLGLFLFAALQGLTGLGLYRPDVFNGIANWFGGVAATRAIHYFLTWVFVAIVITHVYLAFSETFSAVKLMFLGIAEDKE